MCSLICYGLYAEEKGEIVSGKESGGYRPDCEKRQKDVFGLVKN